MLFFQGLNEILFDVEIQINIFYIADTRDSL